MKPWGYGLVLCSLLCTLGACQTTVLEKVELEEAQRVAGWLQAQGIPARIEITGADEARLQVDDASLARTMSVLRAHDFARTRTHHERDQPTSLVPTRSEELTHRAGAIARELERSLERMPGVASARVHVALPITPAYASALASSPRASVLVHRRHGSRALDRDAIARVVAFAVPDLSRDAIDVIELPPTAAAPAPAWTRVGPFTVASASAPALRAALIALLVLQTVLAAVLIVVVTRARRARRPMHAPDDANAA